MGSRVLLRKRLISSLQDGSELAGCTPPGFTRGYYQPLPPGEVGRFARVSFLHALEFRRYELLQGLKPGVDLIRFCGMIHRGGSCPDIKPLQIELWASFSGSLEACSPFDG